MALQLPPMEMRKDGCRWVGAVALAVSHHLCFERKVSSACVSLGTTRSALAVSPSDASVVVALVIGSASVVLAFLPLLETR